MDENETLEDISTHAATLKEQVGRFIAPRLAENKDLEADSTTDGHKSDPLNASQAVDNVVREALNGLTVSKDRPVDHAEKVAPSAAPGAASDQPDASERGGGIPPKTMGAAKNFPGDRGTASRLSEKKIKSIQRSVRRTGYVQKSKKRIRIAPSDLARVVANVKSKQMIKLFELILENPGLELPEAMKIMGYGKTIPPSRIANSKGWQYLVNVYFKDNDLQEREEFLLYNKDPRWVNASLDRLHKIKGSFNHTQKHEVGAPGAFEQKTDQELLDMANADVVEGELVEDETQNDDPDTSTE